MARSLNKVQLIGNLTRDPELRYTPSGAAVCSFGIATNRSWTTDTGEKREEADFHNIVAWNKLAEICSQYLVKGRKAYVEGRLSTRSWTGNDGQQRTRTEVIIDDMIILDSRGGGDFQGDNGQAMSRGGGQGVSKSKGSHGGGHRSEPEDENGGTVHKKGSHESKKANSKDEGDNEEEVSPDDIPF
jgi:single-strand DNA-binding protein